MRRDLLISIGLVALIAASSGSAVAADIGARPMGTPPPAASPASPGYPAWAGFYLGINGGGGWGNMSFDQATFPATGINPFAIPNSSPSGGVVGFQFGYNWQWGPVVGGLEIDYDGADINQTSTFFPQPTSALFTLQSKIDELASARGRLGYLILPNWLLYGTAGFGWGSFRLNTTGTNDAGVFESETADVNNFGWVAGAGVEWQFWNHWLLRGEWLHYDFGRTSEFSSIFGSNLDVRTTVDVGRAGLSYKF
jgi:opacity protein-like surface antigen